MTNNDYLEIAAAISKNDWDEDATIQGEKYSISQFQGTAFDSDYKCYRVQWSELKHIVPTVHTKKSTCSFVAKQTNLTENTILRMLSEKQFPVPKLGPTLRSSGGSIIIFMELLPGVELYACPEHSAWINAVTELSKVHHEFWGADSIINNSEKIPTSNILSEKMHQAYTNIAHNSVWKDYIEIVFKRFDTAPQTLIHGDMFPTNILVHNGKTTFVDWANAGMAPYPMDVGRLTSIIDRDTLLPMCPCSEKVIRTYFDKMVSVLQINYDDYLKEIYMAQFIELAYFYSPPGFYGYKDKYNQKIEQRLHEIVTFHFK